MKTIKLSFAQIMILTVSCVTLGAISVGYVAAQTRTSTEEGTSTPETAAPPATLGEVEGTSTTTESAPADAGTEQETASTPVDAPGALSAAAAAVSDIMALEQEHMSKYGRYLQVMPGNTLPSTESGSVQSKFGKAWL